MIFTFDSTMPGALQLSGTAGALENILKTYLVTGAGAGPVATLTVADGVATATYASGHPFKVGAIAQFAGATPASLNGLKSILSVSNSAATFAAPGVPDGAASGTITSKLAPAGWQELFGGTLANVIALNPSAIEATGCVLRVDDTGTTTARVRAYESMSDISAGVGPTPLDTQVSGGLWWPKSGAASTASRPWWLVADERGFFLAVSPQGTDRYTLLWAGDIASARSGDAYAWLVTGSEANQTAITTGAPHGCCGYSSRSRRTGSYMVRSYTGTGQSVSVMCLGAHHNGSTDDVYAGLPGYGYGQYPNGANNGLLTGVLELYELGVRGTLPGLLHPIQDCGTAFASGALVQGTDDMAGRTLLALRVAPPSGSGSAGTVFLDITGPWSR